MDMSLFCRLWIFLLVFWTSPLFALDKVVLGLKWLHQFQFAGVYAAKEQGFYQEEGLELEIVEKKKDSDLVKLLLAGKYDFIINDAVIFKNRLKGEPVVILATLFQRSPLVFISLSEKEIHSPADWPGKKVMYSKDMNQPIIDLLIEESGAPNNSFYHVEQTFNTKALDEGKVDVMSAYLGVQTFYYDKQNKQLNIIYPANFGIDFYGDMLITSEQYFKNHQDRALAFRRATLKGWEYALEHPEEIASLIYNKYSKRRSIDALMHEAKYTKKMFNNDIIELGHISQKRLKNIAEFYVKQNTDLNFNQLKGLYYTEHLKKKANLEINALIFFLFSVVGLVIIGAFLFRKQTRRKIHQLQTKNQAMLDSIKDGAVIANPKGIIFYINPSIEKIFGFGKEELLLNHIETLMPEDIASKHSQYIKRYMQSGESRIIGKARMTIAKKKCGKTFPIEISISKFTEHNKPYFFAIIKDISQKQEMESSLNKINELQNLYITEQSDSVVYDKIIDFLMLQTNSKLAFLVSEVIDEGNVSFLKFLSVSAPYNQQSHRLYKAISDQNFILKSDYTIFASILKKRDALILNNISDRQTLFGLPHEPKALKHLLGVPILNQSGVVGLYLVANCTGGYEPNKIERYSNLANLISPMLDALNNKEMISELIIKDKLTNLFNRSYFKSYISDLIRKQEQLASKEKFAIILVDIDGLKEINELYGSELGDAVLKEASRRLKQSLGARDVLARIGDDEFGVVLESFDSTAKLVNVVEELSEASKRPIELSEKKIMASFKIGICVYPESGNTVDVLLSNLFVCLEKCKNNKTRVEFFDETYGSERHKRILVKEQLVCAFEKKEFYFVYQPQVNMRTGEIVGAEALIRWRHNDNEIPPSDFIYLLEEYNYAETLNLYNLENILPHFTLPFSSPKPFKLSINLSPMVGNVTSHLQKLITLSCGSCLADNVLLEFEITEEALSDKKSPMEKGSSIMKLLHQHNISLALDDFGTKYSSLNRIFKFDFRTLKIDMSFVRKLDDHDYPEGKIIVDSILNIARTMNARVVAEGVETKHQKQVLLELGCEIAQGFLFYKPLLWPELEKLIKA